jgi:peptide/nickel transport system permease protein
MLRYVAKRLLALVPVLFVVSVVIFGIIHLTPGDPARIMLGPEATSAQVDNLREEMGLDRPILAQYWTWVSGALTGDLGSSQFLNMSVAEAISTHLAPTVSLAILALVINLSIALPTGIAAARRRGTLLDQSVMVGTLMAMAVPSFLLGLILALVAGVWLGWLPVAGYAPLSAGLGEHLRYLVLPALSLGTISAALIARTTRASMLDVLRMDYVRTALAKGVGERGLTYRHALRNAAMPILTVVGVTFGALITGAVVTENIFNLPGLGKLIINAIERRDYAVIQGVVLFVTVVYLSLNLLIDLLYGFIDPRVRLEGGTS